MDNVQSATTRLRRTFTYPSEESSITDAAEVLDEEEQENLIASLTEQNDLRNAQFCRLLVVVPLVSTIPYLPALFRPATCLLSLLALTSLASTAYLLQVLPPPRTGIRFLDNLVSASGSFSKSSPSISSSPADSLEHANLGRRSWQSSSTSYGDSYLFGRRLHWIGVGDASSDTPLRTWLPYLNVGLCILVCILGILVQSHSIYWPSWLLGLGNLPTLVYGLVLVAKIVMAGVDPEKEMSGLRYEYKGA
ncbi:hypothetical protein VTK73DRAFT_7336 [Phialemonium thermophilum]|uniref:Uncharacterized protein n=1 Tax=Phialemonium thermophilum TaxID=223376 RepID=A0ABR3XU30_9PEZI